MIFEYNFDEAYNSSTYSITEKGNNVVTNDTNLNLRHLLSFWSITASTTNFSCTKINPDVLTPTTQKNTNKPEEETLISTELLHISTLPTTNTTNTVSSTTTTATPKNSKHSDLTDAPSKKRLFV